MKPRGRCSLARGALPAVVCGRPVRFAWAGFLALGILTLVLISLDNDAYAFIRWRDHTVRVVDADGYLNCRFGVGQGYRSVMSYNVSFLNAGWYVDWKTQISPPQPGGIEYVQILHVDGSSYSPFGSELADRIAANPGALWLIGNEPDCIWQDSVLPQDYAQAYRDAYTDVKAQDPAARVAVGGIVQPTPLRMQYLDIVLDTYASLYGEPLPTDAWHIHSYILREQRGSWGCDIPPGITADEGMLYTLDDTDDLEIFKQRIRQFRQWMRERGYRDTPLIITECGTLLPYYDPDSLYYDSEGNPFDEERARDFMYGTFAFLRTASDPDVGFPADENRLVQRWLWYSLDDSNYGGALFDRISLSPMQLGIDFGAYTGAISPTVDLFAVDVGPVVTVSCSPTETVTVTLRARISNGGNIAVAQPVTVRFLDGKGDQIGSDQVIVDTIAGCAEVREVTAVWPNAAPGAYVVKAVVDPEGEVNEANEANNTVGGVVLVAQEQVFLAFVMSER